MKLNEDETFLWRLVFSCELTIDEETFGHPTMLVCLPLLFRLLGSNALDFESQCPNCEKSYKPIADIKAEKLGWLKPCCDPCLKLMFAGHIFDEVVHDVRMMIAAKGFAGNFDSWCAQYPRLIQESITYQRCFSDWKVEVGKLQAEIQALKKSQNRGWPWSKKNV